MVTGCCQTVVIFRALSQPREGSYTQFVGDRASGAAAFTAPYGAAHAPLTFALNYYMRYQRLFGARREHMAAYVLAARRGANLNPAAIFSDVPLTFEDYMSCRMIADPMCLLRLRHAGGWGLRHRGVLGGPGQEPAPSPRLHHRFRPGQLGAARRADRAAVAPDAYPGRPAVGVIGVDHPGRRRGHALRRVRP